MSPPLHIAVLILVSMYTALYYFYLRHAGCLRSKYSHGSLNPRQLVRLSRPHTIKATAIACITGYLVIGLHSFYEISSIIGKTKGSYSDQFICYGIRHLLLRAPSFLVILISGVSVNIFVVVLNQLTDVVVDVDNNKSLPIATGEVSFFQGEIVVFISLMISILGASLISVIWLGTVSTVSVIGLLYSMPPFRLKRNAFSAISCIAFSRGIVSIIGGTLTYCGIFETSAIPLYHMFVFSVVLTVFSSVVAMMKDIPDIRGDVVDGVSNMAVKYGGDIVSRICYFVLSALYLFIIALNSRFSGLDSILISFSHLLLYSFLVLQWKSARSDSSRCSMTSKNSMDIRFAFNYYRVIWTLFYLEFPSYLLPVLISSHTHLNGKSSGQFPIINQTIPDDENVIDYIIPNAVSFIKTCLPFFLVLLCITKWRKDAIQSNSGSDFLIIGRSLVQADSGVPISIQEEEEFMQFVNRLIFYNSGMDIESMKVMHSSGHHSRVLFLYARHWYNFRHIPMDEFRLGEEQGIEPSNDRIVSSLKAGRGLMMSRGTSSIFKVKEKNGESSLYSDSHVERDTYRRVALVCAAAELTSWALTILSKSLRLKGNIEEDKSKEIKENLKVNESSTSTGSSSVAIILGSDWVLTTALRFSMLDSSAIGVLVSKLYTEYLLKICILFSNSRVTNNRETKDINNINNETNFKNDRIQDIESRIKEAKLSLNIQTDVDIFRIMGDGSLLDKGKIAIDLVMNDQGKHKRVKRAMREKDNNCEENNK